MDAWSNANGYVQSASTVRFHRPEYVADTPPYSAKEDSPAIVLGPSVVGMVGRSKTTVVKLDQFHKPQ